jgi:hypothetical protein
MARAQTSTRGCAEWPSQRDRSLATGFPGGTEHVVAQLFGSSQGVCTVT